MAVINGKERGKVYYISDVARRVAKATGYTRADVNEICNEFVRQLIEIAKEGNSFRIESFFKMYSIIRPARSVRNPRTEERMRTPEMLELRIKVSDILRKEVRELNADYVKEITEAQKNSGLSE